MFTIKAFIFEQKKNFWTCGYKKKANKSKIIIKINEKKQFNDTKMQEGY